MLLLVKRGKREGEGGLEGGGRVREGGLAHQGDLVRIVLAASTTNPPPPAPAAALKPHPQIGPHNTTLCKSDNN